MTIWLDGEIDKPGLSDYTEVVFKVIEPVTPPQDPNQYLQCARQKQSVGDYQGALQIYLVLLQQFPKHTGLINACGQMEMQQGHGKAAVQHFLRSLEIKPEQVNVWLTCGQLWQAMHGYKQAIRCFSQALEMDETCVRAVSMRALSYQTMGHLDQALQDCTLAVQMKPDAAAYYNRGTIYLRLERPSAALHDFDQALELKPDHANALINRGITKLALSQTEEALADFDRAVALSPKTVAAHSERAIALKALNRPGAALEASDRALALCDTDGSIWNSRGLILLDLSRPDAARSAFARAVALSGEDAGFRNHLAVALRLCGDCSAALAEVERALELNPEDNRAHLNHGQILAALKRPGEAITAFDRAVEIEPYNGEAFAERGRVLLHMNRPAEAAGSFGRALAIHPDDGQNWCNHGSCWVRMNRAAEARYDFDMAQICDPMNAEIQWNAALCDLTLGRNESGWPLYEARLRRPPIDKLVRRFTGPRWDGHTDVRGKHILLYAEQGAGDVLQFCRYIPALKAAGALITLMVHTPLLPVLKNLTGVDLLLALNAPAPAYDLQCPVLSLPLAFQNAGWAAPVAEPYLTAAPARVSAWAEQIGKRSRPQIGLVVSGAPGHANDANRSAPLTAMSALLQADAGFWLLQPQIREADQEAAQKYQNLHLPQAALSDYGETAGLIAALDLVITVDTSVAHLAGAMGKPVWLMLPWCAEWRWGERGETTHWYPTMRLFRQNAPGNWSHMAEDLAELLKKNIFPHRALC